jgi:hypothetical protein
MSLKCKNLMRFLERCCNDKGDTITYNVNGLKAKKDYTTEEVIKRILVKRRRKDTDNFCHGSGF